MAQDDGSGQGARPGRRNARVAPLALALCMAAPLPAAAQTILPASAAVGQSVEQGFAAQMRAEGYVNVQVTRTWLGRIRVLGWLDGRMREVIIHPTSGEVLRDYIEPPALYASALDHDASNGDPSAVTPSVSALTTSTAKSTGLTDETDGTAFAPGSP